MGALIMLNRILVVDTETGGLDPAIHPLLSLGAVVLDAGFEPLGDFEVKLNEGIATITDEALAVHGISKALIEREGVAPENAIECFHTFLHRYFPKLAQEKIILVGHNIHFDRAFLMRLYKLAGLDFNQYFSHRMIDTAGLFAFLMLAGLVRQTELSSDAMFEALGVTPSRTDRHTSLGDALATAASLKAMMRLVTRSYEPTNAIHGGA